MNTLILDAHPLPDSLVSHLCGVYADALPKAGSSTRIAVRDLAFDFVMRAGYRAPQALEPDLQRVADALADCDHLVVAFPLWWGAEPAALKALLDRVLLPGFAFRYRRQSPLWDRLLRGRSADLIVTMDTPPWYLRLVYGDAVVRRWRGQILGFCGFAPIRVFRFGPTRRGGAARGLPGWEARLRAAADSAVRLGRAPRLAASLAAEDYAEALRVRDPDARSDRRGA